METIINTPPTARSRARSESRFDQQFRALQHLLDGQLLIAQDRCVDALLDLYNAAPNQTVRDVLGEMMSDIRYVSAVRVQLLRDDLTLLANCR